MLGAYVHVPFCATRCGYCDFNTYTAAELTRDGSTVSVGTYTERVLAEIIWTRAVAARNGGPVDTVFFGGGTPTLMPAGDLVAILEGLRGSFGLADGAEVTVEANPDSVDRAYLEQLREGGFTRVSFGHQSGSPAVLAFLERTHTPGRTWSAVEWARAAGFDHVSVDLIYGSPVETTADLQATLDEVRAAPLDHVSAYSLIVEEGTRLGARVARGDIAAPSDDVAAERYQLIDAALSGAGYEWYEVSNWARPGGECRHNLGYWRGDDWLGIGPGAHAHLGGVRSWNVKHPAAWAARVDAGLEPWDGSEIVDAATRDREAIMLRLRLREGLPIALLDSHGREAAHAAASEGLLDVGPATVRLTDRGRLLADGLVTRLWPPS